MESVLAAPEEPDDAPDSRGRPPLLTPAVQAKLCELLASGVIIKTAAGFVGVSKATIHRWMALGRKKGSGIYRQFRQEVLRALAQAEIREVLVINKAGPKDWRAAAWILERRWPERWGRTTRDRAVEAQDRPSPEQLAAQIREFLKASRDLDSPAPPTESKA